MYKLIALDMDGTLLREDGTISERTSQAIGAARDKGVRVVLASGRPLEGLERYLEELGLTSHDDYVLSYNGSLVQNVGSRQVIRSHILSGADAHHLFRLSQEVGVNIHAFSSQRGLITPRTSTYTELERTINDVPLTELDFNSLEPEHEIIKIMLIDEPEVLARGKAALPESLYEQYTVVQSAPFFLEILNKQSNKGSGLASLAAHLNIEPAEIICVGDAGNDRHMLEYAGLGVAMGNASPEIKAIADFISHSNEEDGVAHVIETFILQSGMPS